MAWFDSEWNTPSRSDYYLMQIAQEVRRVLAKNPGNIKLGDFKIPFEREGAKPEPPSAAKTSMIKSIWLGLVGKWRTNDGQSS